MNDHYLVLETNNLKGHMIELGRIMNMFVLPRLAGESACTVSSSSSAPE